MVSKEFFQALMELEKERKVSQDMFISTMEAGLSSAYKKETGLNRGIDIQLNPSKYTIRVFAYRDVVETVEDPDRQISLEDARKVKEIYNIGDHFIDEELSPKLFSRIAAQTAKQAAKVTAKAIKAAIAAAKALVRALLAGGWVVVLVAVVLCLIGLLVGSCFGIFFSGEDTGTGQTIRTAIAQVNQEYQDKLEEIQSSHTYDTLEITGSQAVWKEVLAVYAVKVTTGSQGQDVASMDEEKLGLLAEVFWEMNQVSANVETRTETTQNEDGEAVKTEITVLVISVSHKTAQEMAEQLGFEEEKKEQLQELLSPEYDDLWNELLYGIALGGGNGDLVAVAQSQVGNVGGAPYWSWYGFSSRVEWCAIFVSWCADQCGLLDSGAIPRFSGVGTGVNWFQSRGQWLPGSATPEPGMLIFFKWYDSDATIADHVGIVERVEDGRVYTIEGNSNDMVRRNSYPIGYGEIKGYGVLTPGRVENALLT